jgi:hypothetical protein
MTKTTVPTSPADGMPPSAVSPCVSANAPPGFVASPPTSTRFLCNEVAPAAINPLAAAYEAAKAAWIEANALYEPRRVPYREWLAIYHAYTAVEAAATRIELERRRRGAIQGESLIDLANVVAFERPVKKPRRRRVRAAALQ